MVDHIEALMRAVTHIEASLDRPFALEPTARAAGMSPYHFSHVFAALTGEPASEYARKRRLARAAELLLASDQPVVEVALACGFEGQAAFTRAFSRWYGLPPARFRRQSRPLMVKDTPPLTRAILEALTVGEVLLEPRIVCRSSAVLVGVACTNTVRVNGIASCWGRFLARIGEVSGAVDLSTYGVYRYDFAADPALINEDFDFDYLAAVAVAPNTPPPRGMVRWEIDKARYAVFVHRGLLANLPRTYRHIFKTWFPRQTERLAAAPHFEYRAADYPGDREGAETEIWVPMEDSA